MNREQQQERNTEQEATVVRRHDEGQDFARIGRDLGISRERARFIYRRWDRERQAAS